MHGFDVGPFLTGSASETVSGGLRTSIFAPLGGHFDVIWGVGTFLSVMLRHRLPEGLSDGVQSAAARGEEGGEA